MGIEHLTIRPMTGQPIVSVIIMTLGIATLFDSLMAAIFGTVERSLPATFPTGGLSIRGISLAYEYLFSFIIASAMVGFFLYFFQYTRLGLNMRAVADGHDKARSCGVKVGAVFRLAWAISASSAMAGGFLLGNIESVSINLSGIALRVFPVIVLGGIDSIWGCIVAGPIVGILEIMAAGYVDPITQGGAGDVMASVIIVLTLIFKPFGIFGQKHIERI
jgi:branched-chain amino acid transport system permease protein